MPWAYAGSRLALMLRRLRGRFGISAPQVSVRTQMPWHLRMLGYGVAAIGLFALAVWAYDAGRRVAGFDQGETSLILEQLRAQNALLNEEVIRLRNLLTASESSLQIEHATQKLLSEKNGTLVSENNKLREELAVFERLAKFEGKRDSDIALDQLSVKADGPKGAFRYSFLLALQGTRRGKEAKFSLQIVVTPHGESAGAKITLPRREEADPGQFEFTVRNFRRIDGRFVLPAGVSPALVEIRILEAGVLRTSKSVNL